MEGPFLTNKLKSSLLLLGVLSVFLLIISKLGLLLGLHMIAFVLLLIVAILGTEEND